MREGQARRRATHGRGLSAETLALAWLLLRGYRPLARRFAASGGEIDLVCRRGRTIVLVEVKARPSLEEARAAITPEKRRRIARAARAWAARNPWAAACTIRADAVFVAPGRWPEHVAGVFEIDI